LAKTYSDLVSAALDTSKSYGSNYEPFFAEWGEYQDVLTEKFRTLLGLQEKAFSRNYIARQTGIGVDALTQYMNIRRFGLGVVSLSKLCYKFFNMSCQEFVTGERAPAFLPQDMSYLADILSRCLRYHSLTSAMSKVASYQEKCQKCIQKESEYDIFRERLMSVWSERYVSLSRLLRVSNEMRTPLPIVKSLLSEQQVPAKKRTHIKLSTSVYLSIVTNMPIDYFFVRDYTVYLPMAFRRFSGNDYEDIQIGSTVIQRLVHSLLLYPQTIRPHLIAEILVEYQSYLRQQE